MILYISGYRCTENQRECTLVAQKTQLEKEANKDRQLLVQKEKESNEGKHLALQQEEQKRITLRQQQQHEQTEASGN